MAAPPSSHLVAILLVDGGNQSRMTTRLFLVGFGFAVELARNAEEALTMFDPRVHDVVIAHQTLPGITGIELAHIIKMRSRLTPVILFSGTPLEQISCIDCVLNEPVHPLVMKDAVERLLADQPSDDLPFSRQKICQGRWHGRMWGIRQSHRHQGRN